MSLALGSTTPPECDRAPGGLLRPQCRGAGSEPSGFLVLALSTGIQAEPWANQCLPGPSPHPRRQRAGSNHACNLHSHKPTDAIISSSLALCTLIFFFFLIWNKAGTACRPLSQTVRHMGQNWLKRSSNSRSGQINKISETITTFGACPFYMPGLRF